MMSILLPISASTDARIGAADRDGLIFAPRHFCAAGLDDLAVGAELVKLRKSGAVSLNLVKLAAMTQATSARINGLVNGDGLGLETDVSSDRQRTSRARSVFCHIFHDDRLNGRIDGVAQDRRNGRRAGRRLVRFVVAMPTPCAGCDRQVRRPGRLLDQQFEELLLAAETGRHFGDDLIMHMHHNRIAGGLDPEHRFNQDVARDTARQCSRTRCRHRRQNHRGTEQTGRRNCRRTRRAPVSRPSRMRRGLGYESLRPLGSLIRQELAVALQDDRTADEFDAGLMNRLDGGADRYRTRTHDLRMRRAPFVLERLDFFVAELVRLEFPPGTEAAHIAKREVAGLADLALAVTALV